MWRIVDPLPHLCPAPQMGPPRLLPGRHKSLRSGHSGCGGPQLLRTPSCHLQLPELVPRHRPTRRPHHRWCQRVGIPGEGEKRAQSLRSQPINRQRFTGLPIISPIKTSPSSPRILTVHSTRFPVFLPIGSLFLSPMGYPTPFSTGLPSFQDT